jgi:ATP-dependent Clp protease ATP-binding subunit ClpC
MSVNDLVGLNNFNLTPRVKKAFKDAQSFSKTNNDKIVNNLHILHGCIQNLTGDIKDFLVDRGADLSLIDTADMLSSVRMTDPEKFAHNQNSNTWHPELTLALNEADDISSGLDQYYIGIEHVLMGILSVSDYINIYFYALGLNASELLGHLYDFISGDVAKSHETGVPSFSKSELDPQAVAQALSKFGTNLNQLAIEGNIPDVYGREDEINALIEVLLKKKKRNAILLGESGVGKTAIIEGLAKKIAFSEVAPIMAPYVIYSIDLGAMIQGTRYRGEFEEKFYTLLNIARTDPHIILFFDEIHNLFGAGNTKGSIDAANMLKPFLARGEIRCIGATTTQEYQEIFEKDSAMKRRFEPIEIGEPSREASRLIIARSAPSYEEFHNIRLSPTILDYVIDCCEKFLPHRRFPDKAFDILDQIGSRVKINNCEPSEELKEKHEKILESIHSDEFNREETEVLINQYLQGLNECLSEAAKNPRKVAKADVREVIAKQAKIAVDEVKDSFINFDRFFDKISKEVIGQSENLEKVNDLLSYAKVGLTDPDKPLASFLFVGPTSVGKTHTAKQIAKYYFGNEKAFIQINMSELQDETAIGKLIGANAGYVGYDNGGLLTNFVRNNPNSLVLFDEIEKANPKVLNLLLHLLDEGYLVDNRNCKIDFTKSIVVLTSNIGHEQAQAKSMGFNPEVASEQTVYIDSVKKQIRPEILARINEVIVFNTLGNDVLIKIVKKEISKFQAKLLTKQIKLNVCDQLAASLIEKHKDSDLHARKIKDLIKKELIIPAAKFVIRNPKNREICAKMIDSVINFS